MNPEEHNALPQELEDSLRALGDVRAPSELADRVRLARLGQVSAPAELRDRVEMALFGAAQAPAELEERVRAEVRQLTRPVLAFPFRLTLPRAAAAAVLVVGSIMLGPWSSTETAPVDPGAYLAAKNAAAEKVLMVRVSADELSEGAQSLARGFGAPLERGGAQ
ncbi:MAG: hypothetical protein CMJ94_08045 [Planctomycetes bacterium]|nr:hypothetical protein [Planctomycetota bacterium]